ncbi:DUF2961 domain-containing protein [Compostibacter hankyongensis]|uniref:DUF2961 domain-containing protein n=1 Tax=Compostibacter hankyongensis TaxID=1007089 RepID=A0ABP8FJC6_9BACT
MKQLFFLLLLACAGTLFCISCREKEDNSANVVTGLEAMAKVERLPFLFPPGTKKNRFISYDASGGNGFGLLQSTFKKYIDSSGELVIFDAYGPGCLYRQQMNIWKGIGQMSPTLRIRYYFDDEATPKVDLPVKEFFSGQHAPITAPFTLLDKHDNFGICYYPFPFSKRLKVTLSDTLITRLLKENNDDGRNWYQYDYLTYPQGTMVNSWTSESDEYEKTVKEQWTHLGSDPKDTAGNRYTEKHVSLQPNEKAVVFASPKEGSVTGIQLKISPYSAETFYNTYIRIYWDDLKPPAVDMPVSYFFGGGGWKDNKWEASLSNLLFGFDAGQHSMYCYWPMPFWKKARIEIVNKSKTPISALTSRIAYKPASVYRYPQHKAAYFMAKLTKDSADGAWTRKFERPYVNAFKEEGHGQVVSVNMWSGNFLEDGDEFTYIDDQHMPRIHGDGTEDDFNQGWAGFTYAKPLWGALISGVKGSYRIHMNEPYIFYNSIDMRFEQTGGRYGYPAMLARRRTGTDTSTCETEFVVCYYKAAGGRTLLLSDSLDVGDAVSEQSHAYKITGQQWSGTLTQSYDSYATADDYNETTDNGRSFNGYSEFSVHLNPQNEGVRLTARINRSGNGIQTGNVYVDGKKLPLPWHIVTYSDMPQKGERSFDGWFDSEYEIPKAYTQGKKQVTVKIEYVQSVKRELNSFRYWVYCYRQ